MHVSLHLLAPVGQFSLISPSLTLQPDVCLCPQPLNQSSYALFSLDCTRPFSSALDLWSSLTCRSVLLVRSSLLFLPYIPASPSYPPLHAFLSVWSLAYGSCFLILSFPFNSFLPGTQLGSLLIPASGSCSLVPQQGAGSQGHSSLICLFVCLYIYRVSLCSKISSSFLPSSSNIPALALAGMFGPGMC